MTGIGRRERTDCPRIARWFSSTAAGILSVTFVAPLQGQARVENVATTAYSTVTVALSGVTHAGSGRLQDYWDAGTGARLDVHMPFHLGEAGLTATTLRYETRAAAQPGFRAIIIGANWRFPSGSIQLGGVQRVRPQLSVEAGNFMTIFDGEQVKGLGKESEIYIGAGAGLGVALAGRTSLTVGADARYVFTSTPVRLVSLRAGLAHTWATPRWLRAVVE